MIAKRSANDAALAAVPWYRQRWPWLLMLGPVLVVLAGAYTIWLSFSMPDAMVVDDYYQRGQAINQDLSRDQAARRLGLSVVLRYEPASGRITGRLSGQGVADNMLAIHLAHATQPAKDRVLRTRSGSQGEFAVELPMFEQGRWQVLVESERRDWRLTGTWKWPAERSFTASAMPERGPAN